MVFGRFAWKNGLKTGTFALFGLFKYFCLFKPAAELLKKKKNLQDPFDEKLSHMHGETHDSAKKHFRSTYSFLSSSDPGKRPQKSLILVLSSEASCISQSSRLFFESLARAHDGWTRVL